MIPQIEMKNIKELRLENELPRVEVVAMLLVSTFGQ